MPCEFQLRLSAPSQLFALICDSLRRLVGPAWRAGGQESMTSRTYIPGTEYMLNGMCYRIHRGELVLTAQLAI